MILGTARYINSLPFDSLPRIVIDGAIVQFRESVVYLGLTISQTLSWDKQVTRTVSKVNAALYQFKLCGHLFSLSLHSRLIVALIFPLFGYCCTVLIDITGEFNLKSCVRFIFRAKWDEHITPYFETLGWLKI